MSDTTQTTQHPGTPETHAEGVATVLGETETPLARAQRERDEAREDHLRYATALHWLLGFLGPVRRRELHDRLDGPRPPTHESTAQLLESLEDVMARLDR